MDYKTIISAIRMRYNRLSTKEGLPKLDNEEILFELSVNQLELQSLYQIVDSEVHLLTLAVGTDVYTVGAGATHIPTDILKITNMKLSDEINSEIKPIGDSELTGYTKMTGKPLYYCFTGQGSDQKLEFDTKPEAVYTVTIKYVPKFELFLPDSFATSLRWADYDPTEDGWGGGLDLPQDWLIILMDLTLAKLIGNPTMLQDAMVRAEALSARKPVHSSREIPYDDGVYSDMANRALLAGEDRVRSRR